MNAPEPLNLPARLRTIAARRGHHTALVDESGLSTYGELVEAMDATAAQLLRLGVQPGDRVGAAMEPSSAYATFLLGCLAAGVVAAPINTRLAPPEARDFLATLQPTLVVCDGVHQPLAEATGYDTIALLTTHAPLPLRERLGPFGRTAPPIPAVSEDAPAIIIATGGTTGTPKGVFYDHRRTWLFMAAGSAYDGGNRFDAQLSMSPFFHLALMTGVFARLFAGGTVRTIRRFDPGAALQAIDAGCTRTAAATTLLTMMRRHPSFEQTRRDGLRSLRVGGMAADEDFIRRLISDYPNAQLKHSYAATELGTVTAIEHEDFLAGRISGIGRPHPGAEVLILRPDGREAAPGEIGELVVRAPWTSNGYWGRPDETAQTYRPEGIHTGDLGSVDEDGWFTLTGRAKEMIITGGENVFPVEVEAVLRRCEGVADVIVYGMPDPQWGERIEVGVVPFPGAAVQLDVLRESARPHLAGYKLPKSMRLLDEVPLTTVRKPDRRAARAAALVATI